jgi:hypothetical protein
MYFPKPHITQWVRVLFNEKREKNVNSDVLARYLKGAMTLRRMTATFRKQQRIGGGGPTPPQTHFFLSAQHTTGSNFREHVSRHTTRQT